MFWSLSREDFESWLPGLEASLDKYHDSVTSKLDMSEDIAKLLQKRYKLQLTFKKQNYILVNRADLEKDSSAKVRETYLDPSYGRPWDDEMLKKQLAEYADVLYTYLVNVSFNITKENDDQQ